MAELVLTADLGAGSLRVGAVTPKGRLAAAAAVPIEGAQARHPGWSEIDPEIWWRALGEAVARVLERLKPSDRLTGICVAGLTRSQVLLDGDGRPLRPALLFRDRRASRDASEVARHFPTSNAADAISAFHPLARLAWLARCEAALFDRLGFVAEPKDFLNCRLTGKIAADTVTASRFDGLRPASPSPAWLGRCLELITAAGRFAPWTPIGVVTCREKPFDRLAGLPVFAGAMDAWATAIGAGAVHPGQAYDIAGTSEVVGLITRKRAAVPGLVSLVWGEALHQIGGPTQVGADCATWCHETFRVGGRLAMAVERAARRAPSDDLPLFLPYLAGERAPLWREDVRGMFDGVSRSHGADDFLWATLEGVALAVRDILTTAAAGSGKRVDEIRICGGGARSDGWCQLKADVLGAPVLRVAHRETGLIGAAMAAWIGLGRYAGLGDAADAMCPVDRRFEPRKALAPIYDRRSALYRQAKEAALALADARSAAPDLADTCNRPGLAACADA